MMTRTSTDFSLPLPLVAMMTALLCLSILLPNRGLSQGSDNVLRVERFQIDHRDPSTVRDTLLPMLGRQEHIGVIGDWLVVAATDSTRNRIRDQLRTLDTPIRQLEVTLSIAVPGSQSGDDASLPIIRDLLVETGQLIRLDMSDPDLSDETQSTGPETGRQLSFRLDRVGRTLQVSHAIHPAGAEIDPDTGTQQRIETDNWQTLDEGIDIRVRPQN